jgi:phosphoketolase
MFTTLEMITNAQTARRWALAVLRPDVVIACCGDAPTLEILAAVSILREHLPDLKIRVVNVVDLMKLQPQSEHPHGLSDADSDSDSVFTTDTRVVFGFHGYPWLVHRLRYRRTNHKMPFGATRKRGRSPRRSTCAFRPTWIDFIWCRTSSTDFRTLVAQASNSSN